MRHNYRFLHEEKQIDPDKRESFLQVDTIIFDGVGQECSKYPRKFSIPLRHLKKKVRKEVKELTAIAGSNIALRYIIHHPMFSHHRIFSSFNMKSIPSLFFILLIVYVT